MVLFSVNLIFLNEIIVRFSSLLQAWSQEPLILINLSNSIIISNSFLKFDTNNKEHKNKTHSQYY